MLTFFKILHLCLQHVMESRHMRQNGFSPELLEKSLGSWDHKEENYKVSNKGITTKRTCFSRWKSESMFDSSWRNNRVLSLVLSFHWPSSTILKILKVVFKSLLIFALDQKLIEEIVIHNCLFRLCSFLRFKQ